MAAEKRKCWYQSDKFCKCEKDNDECLELRIQNAKLVYCSDGGCSWNQELPEKVKVERGMTRTPFVDDTDYATGVCSRGGGVFLAFREWTQNEKTKRKATVCLVRSDKKFDRMPTVHPDQIEYVQYNDPNMWV